MRKTKKVMAVVLASAMALAMNVSSVFAAEAEFPVGKANAPVNNGDGTWDVTVTIDASSILKWDIGLVYDSTKLEVVKEENEATGMLADKIVSGTQFKAGIDALGGVIQNYVFAEADKSYVVFAGTQPKDAWPFKGGTIATVTFKAKTDDATASIILVPQDVTGVFKTAEKLNYESALAAGVGTVVELGDVVVTPAPETPAPETPAPETPDQETPAPTEVVGTTDAPKVTTEVKETAAPQATSNTTKSAKTGDTANVVIPMIAICAAAAAVVVASKKRVEE